MIIVTFIVFIIGIIVGYFYEKQNKQEIIELFKAVLRKEKITHIQLESVDLGKKGKVKINKWTPNYGTDVIDVYYQDGEEKVL